MVIYSTRLGLDPDFGRLLADECAAYLRLRFPGHAFDVALGSTSPLGHRSYCVQLCSEAGDDASALIQAAAEAFAYGFRTGWAQREAHNKSVAETAREVVRTLGTLLHTKLASDAKERDAAMTISQLQAQLMALNQTIANVKKQTEQHRGEGEG